MNATFDFVPRFCPYCGAGLLRPPGAEYRTAKNDIKRFKEGERLTCKCGLTYERRAHVITSRPKKTPAQISAIRAAAGRKGGMKTVERHGLEGLSEAGKIGGKLRWGAPVEVEQPGDLDAPKGPEGGGDG